MCVWWYQKCFFLCAVATWHHTKAALCPLVLTVFPSLANHWNETRDSCQESLNIDLIHILHLSCVLLALTGLLFLKPFVLEDLPASQNSSV